MNTCRLCGEVSFRPHEDMYRYGRRHYAHKVCWLERRGIEGLTKSQIEAAPWAAVKRLGLIEQVEQRLAGCAQ
jgi:hypothetical protein